MSETRLITHDDLLAINDASTYVELEVDGCINSELETLWNSLPKLSDVRECLEALIKHGDHGNYCETGQHWTKHGGIKEEHPDDCPVTKAKAILEKIGG